MNERRFDPADLEVASARIAGKTDAYLRLTEPPAMPRISADRAPAALDPLARMQGADASPAASGSATQDPGLFAPTPGAPIDVADILSRPAGMPEPSAPRTTDPAVDDLFRSFDFARLALSDPRALAPVQMPSRQREELASGLTALIAEDRAAESARLQSTLYEAIGKSPDQTAEYLRLQELFGGDLEYIARNEAEMRRRLGVDDIRGAIDYTPVLAQRLTDQRLAALAHDDVPALAAQEGWWAWTVNQFAGMPASFMHGWTEANLAEFAAQQVVGDPMTSSRPVYAPVTSAAERDAGFAWFEAQMREYGEPAGLFRITAATIGEEAFELSRSIEATLIGLGAGAGVGAGATAWFPPAVALGVSGGAKAGARVGFTAATAEQAFRQTSGMIYYRALREGVSEDAARETALVLGATLAPLQFALEKAMMPDGLTSATEREAIKRLASERFAEAAANPTVRAAAGRILKDSARQVGRVTALGGSMAVGFEAANEAALFVDGKPRRMQTAEGRAEIIENVVAQTVYMLQAGAGMHLMMPSSQNLVLEIYREKARLDMAKAQVRALERLNDVAVAVKLAKRAPGDNASLINEASGSKDVYISKAGLKDVIEGMGVPLERMDR